jgi:hypothetical protein
VQANYKETQVRHMRPGDPAEIRVDAFPWSDFERQGLTSGSGERLAVCLVAPDNATGNFHEDRAAGTGEDRAGSGPGNRGQLRPGLSVIAAVRTQRLRKLREVPAWHAAHVQQPHLQLTTHPYIGIVGVFLGAGIATLNARLVSVGLADLRGALGLGFDEASWIPTALNMATMFSGVFVVFLNVLYGPRRILLAAAGTFAITFALLPLLRRFGRCWRCW